jgi:hypothetical protein
MVRPQLGLGGFRDVGTGQQSLIGRLGLRLIDPFGSALLLLALEQLEGRLEVIGERTPFLGLQVVH